MTNETYYTVYKTTNNVNSKVYIGKHETRDLGDNYLGSGNILKSAIAKYGKQHFTRKYLYVFDNELEMTQKEQYLVDAAFVKSKRTYNIALGGKGGCIVLKPDHPLYENTCEKIKQSHIKRSRQTADLARQNHKKQVIGMYGKKHSEATKAKMSKSSKGIPKTKEAVENRRKSCMETTNDPDYISPLKGRILSRDIVDKISANHACVKGENNPMYGKTHREQTISKIREAVKSKPKIRCDHCSTEASPGNHKRWHGDNCKVKLNT